MLLEKLDVKDVEFVVEDVGEGLIENELVFADKFAEPSAYKLLVSYLNSVLS